jgi:hypothetical protein
MANFNPTAVKKISNGKSAVIVCGDAGAEPIPVSVSESTPGLKVFKDGNAVGNPGSDVTVITDTVPVGKTWQLSRLQVSAYRAGKVTVEAGGSIIGTLRTGASAFNPVFEWNPARVIAAGTLVEVKYTQRNGTGASDVEAYLMITEV